MNLHLSPDAFEAIILNINDRENIRTDVLEKDYYVTLLLKELAQNQDQWKAYFKGGTALYKALNSINRFSEDIDLTVFVEDCPSNSQKKARLERAAKGYTSLERILDDSENINTKGSVTTVYGYSSIFSDLDMVDPLQRFGRVKIEATSFTVSEPSEPMSIAPIIYLKATDSERILLNNNFEVNPFDIRTIKLERIFVDKIFAAEFYYQRYKEAPADQRSYAFDVAKHIYDLMVLLTTKRIQRLLVAPEKLHQMIAFKRKEEAIRLGGIPPTLKINTFSYLDELPLDKNFESEYNRMQEVYVFQEKDRISLKGVQAVIRAIRMINE